MNEVTRGGIKEFLNDLTNPIIVIDNDDQGLRYLLNLSSLGPNPDSLLGIVLSDLISSLAIVCVNEKGGEVDDWRKTILDALHLEEKLKKDDPTRGKPWAAKEVTYKSKLN
jgi:hypothetical protein